MARTSAFVTGSTGLLGYNLVRGLLERDVAVKALARDRTKALQQFAGLPVEIVVGDLTDVGTFAHALSGVDAVFHAAAHFRDSYKGGNHRERLQAINVRGTRALLEAAYQRGVRRFVHTSSIAVLDGARGAVIDETAARAERDADDYYRSKILADREVHAFLQRHLDFWAAFVLPGWMFGPGDAGPTSSGQVLLDFIGRKLPGTVPGSFSIVDARDVAFAQIEALVRGRRGERYLAAGRHMTMAELLALLEQITGIRAPTRKIPLLALQAIAGANELVRLFTRKQILLSFAMVKLLARERDRTRFDHSKSERELGLRFRPIEQTLADTFEWYRSAGWISGPVGDSARCLR